MQVFGPIVGFCSQYQKLQYTTLTEGGMKGKADYTPACRKNYNNGDLMMDCNGFIAGKEGGRF